MLKLENRQAFIERVVPNKEEHSEKHVPVADLKIMLPLYAERENEINHLFPDNYWHTNGSSPETILFNPDGLPSMPILTPLRLNKHRLFDAHVVLESLRYELLTIECLTLQLASSHKWGGPWSALLSCQFRVFVGLGDYSMLCVLNREETTVELYGDPNPPTATDQLPVQ